MPCENRCVRTLPPTANLSSPSTYWYPATSRLRMPHSAALQACWTYLADVNLGNTAWPPNDQRCAYRHATLRRAQLACERTPLCAGVARDSGLPCVAAGGVDTVLLRFELRGAGRQPWPGMKAWLLSRNGGVSGSELCQKQLGSAFGPACAPEPPLSAKECLRLLQASASLGKSTARRPPRALLASQVIGASAPWPQAGAVA